ncbi:MAG: helix-turn-helix domain-containing protein [Actinobacteria bacterium]|nr:helix-turn-helix domain-containing protein [Actinomycetota bacterium]
MGAGALPSALLSYSADPAGGAALAPDDELERLRLENETLSAVVGVTASGPDLAHILDRVVDLLTRATDCHACFVYLCAGPDLELRAASPVYTHLVGRIKFGVDQGLAGWAVREGKVGFIRDDATADPRTNYVPELEEERFQSIVAVPIPSREGAAIGVLVLHTVAPREFDERVINVLSRAATLVAGAIENARLYEEAQDRVEALTRLAAFGGDVAAVSDRASLFQIAAAGIRELIEADAVIVYGADGPGGGLRRAAAVPAATAEGRDEERLVEAILDGEPGGDGATEAAAALGLDPGTMLDAVGLSIGKDRIGAILVASAEQWPQSVRELLRAAAQQVALAAEKIALIEHLTEENLARDLFDALGAGDLARAAEKVAAAALPTAHAAFVLEARPSAGAKDGAAGAAELEAGLRRAIPQALCDHSSGSLRALVPVAEAGVDPVRPLIAELDRSGVLAGTAAGVSEARPGIEGLASALREAGDATTVAERLGRTETPLLYHDTGAYRYLIDLLGEGGPDDHLRAAMDTLAAYDRDRGSHLLATLDAYLSSGRMVAASARDLFVHVNTLRQRLDRIEELTGLRLAEEDLLTLQLAVKLGRVRTGRQEASDLNRGD